MLAQLIIEDLAAKNDLVYFAWPAKTHSLPLITSAWRIIRLRRTHNGLADFHCTNSIRYSNKALQCSILHALTICAHKSGRLPSFIISDHISIVYSTYILSSIKPSRHLKLQKTTYIHRPEKMLVSVPFFSDRAIYPTYAHCAWSDKNTSLTYANCILWLCQSLIPTAPLKTIS